MTNSQFQTIETFYHLLQLPSQTAALNTALRLGVFDALAAGQKSSSEIADYCKLNFRGCEALLEILLETRAIEKFGDDYALSQAARMIPNSVWAAVFNQWTELENALREGPAKSSNGNPRKTFSEEFRQHLSQTSWATTGCALMAADALGIGNERKGLRILDLGCGAAIYSMTIAHRDPSSKVTLVDDGPGLAHAKVTVDSLEMEPRVTMVLSDDISSKILGLGQQAEFDLVLCADQINLLNSKQANDLLQRTHQLLANGGELAIVDLFPGQQRGSVSLRIHELHLLIGTGRTAVSLEDIQANLRAAGFTQIQYSELPAPPYVRGLVLATKP